MSMASSCPTCGATYDDDALTYCTTDGTRLVRRVAPSARLAPEAPLVSASDANRTGALAGALGALGVVTLVLIGVIVFLLLKAPAPDPAGASAREVAVQPPSDGRTAGESNGPLTGTEESSEEPEPPTEPEPPVVVTEPVPDPTPDPVPPSEPSLDYVRFAQPMSAYVQTQTDGRIMLRDGPRAGARRIAPVVDGTRVTVFGCQTEARIRTDAPAAGTPGRWCFVRTAADEGWAFDAYLQY